MAYYTKGLSPEIEAMDDYLLDKHYLRKHGEKLITDRREMYKYEEIYDWDRLWY